MTQSAGPDGLKVTTLNVNGLRSARRKGLRDWVRAVWMFAEPYAQPVPTLYHSRNVLPLQTPLPGLWMANMSQVYPWDRGTNYAVELGRRVAKLAGSRKQEAGSR
ncbi:MAG: hypothetical protein ACK4WK_07505 [Anaerolineae bacterium]